VENIYGDWQGYLKRLREFEVTGQPESAFPLPNGKAIGEATPEEIKEFRALWETKCGNSNVTVFPIRSQPGSGTEEEAG
jgi:hypothetical protein